MSYKIVFETSGDTIPFEPVNQDVLDFYINQLNLQKLNSFGSKNKQLGQTILSYISELRNTVKEINTWLYDLAEIKFDVVDDEDYLDQHLLNKMHAVWVNSQSIVYDIQKKRKQFNFSSMVEKIHDQFPDDIQTPLLSDVINKLGFSDIYSSVNVPHIHRLEIQFDRIMFEAGNGWTEICKNHFPKTILTNDHASISISFNHLGRTLYNKFESFDMMLDYDDENSYDEFLGYVTLSLRPAQTIPLSQEYINWCRIHNREPIGDRLNIGNIPNLYENLKKYRIIIFRNLLNNNKFSIQNH